MPKPTHSHHDTTEGRTPSPPQAPRRPRTPFLQTPPRKVSRPTAPGAGCSQMTLERVSAESHDSPGHTHFLPHAQRTPPCAPPQTLGVNPGPQNGAGRGEGREGTGSCSQGGGSGDCWKQAGFGQAGGWVFTLMHRDAAAVPVAINQRVLGPASLV